MVLVADVDGIDQVRRAVLGRHDGHAEPAAVGEQAVMPHVSPHFREVARAPGVITQAGAVELELPPLTIGRAVAHRAGYPSVLLVVQVPYRRTVDVPDVDRRPVPEEL